MTELPETALSRLRPLVEQRDALSTSIETYLIACMDVLGVSPEEVRYDHRRGAFVPKAMPSEAPKAEREDRPGDAS